MASHDNIEDSDEFYDEGSGEEEETEESDDEDEDDDEGESFAEDGDGAPDLEGGRPTDDDEDESEDSDDITDSSEEKADKDYADEPRNKENKEERRRRLGFVVLCCCFLVILLAVILGVTLGGKEDVNPSTPTSSKSIPPSPAPTQSLAPTSLPSLDEGAVDFNATMDPTDDLNATRSPLDSPALDDNITDSTASPSSAVAPSDPPGEGNATTSPTSASTQSPTSSKSPSQAPTLDPAKIYFPVVADTSVTKATARRRAQSGGDSRGTSGVLQVASTNDSVASMTLLQFALTEIPPPENALLESSFHLHLVAIPSTGSAPISIYRYISQVALDIENLVWNDSLPFLSSGRIQAGSFPEGQIIEGTTFSVKSNDTVKVPITDLLSTDDIVVRRRNLQDAATTTILLLLQINPTNGPGEQSFKSREAGAIVAPVITHEYIFNVTSCEPNPCGALAHCWSYEDGSIACECDNGKQVEYLEMCPLDSVICLQNKVLDVDKLECLCPKDKQETDADDFCYAAGSPCLDGPCTGVGSVCVDDGSGGYTCSCPDDSVVGATVNCDFATITTCDPPNPCGKEAYCAEIFDEEGAMTAGCQCNDDDREVEFGESCILV